MGEIPLKSPFTKGGPKGIHSPESLPTSSKIGKSLSRSFPDTPSVIPAKSLPQIQSGAGIQAMFLWIPAPMQSGTVAGSSMSRHFADVPM